MKLGDISDFINGGAWSDKAYVEEGYKVVKVTNMINGSVESRNDNFLSEESYKKYFKHKLYTSDLIIATVGSHPSQQGSVVGRTSIVPEDYNYALLNQNAVCIRITDERISQKFFNYLTKTIVFKHHIESRAQGSANQVRMALSELKKFSFCYPSLKTQQKIASLLSNYDKLIENNTQRITLLESMAEELYKEWFVRLRFPGHEEVEVLDGVPEGWERKVLINIAKLVMGQSPKSDAYNQDKNGLPFHQGVTNYGFRFPSHNTWSTEGKRYAEKGDILFSVRAPVGRLNITPDKLIIGRGLASIRHKREWNSFIFYALKEIFFEEDLIGSGSIFSSVTKKDMENILILEATENIMNRFNHIVEPIDREIETLLNKNQTLKQTRDLLLPRLMSGKLNVEDLDII